MTKFCYECGAFNLCKFSYHNIRCHPTLGNSYFKMSCPHRFPYWSMSTSTSVSTAASTTKMTITAASSITVAQLTWLVSTIDGMAAAGPVTLNLVCWLLVRVDHYLSSYKVARELVAYIYNHILMWVWLRLPSLSCMVPNRQVSRRAKCSFLCCVQLMNYSWIRTSSLREEYYYIKYY